MDVNVPDWALVVFAILVVMALANLMLRWKK